MDREVSGVIKAVATHPSNADVVYVGAVNEGPGGRERQGSCANRNRSPTRRIAFDRRSGARSDGRHRQTLVAGTGVQQPDRMGGGLIGVLRTIDGGTSWLTFDAVGCSDVFASAASCLR